IAQTGNSHTIGESLLLPAAKDIVSLLLGSKAAKQLDVVPLSDNTVSRRIEEMAFQVKGKLIESIKHTKKMLLNLKVVLDQAVKVVNFIKTRPLNSHLFSLLCSEMGNEQETLLHTELTWLSHGKVLTHLFELHSEVQLFLSDTTFDFASCFTNELWLSRLAYLADIFS
ncbi:ZBED5 protein, partial [Polyodon spathula]|nr:ZBED5 protein [Polyodon spathula]